MCNEEISSESSKRVDTGWYFPPFLGEALRFRFPRESEAYQPWDIFPDFRFDLAGDVCGEPVPFSDNGTSWYDCLLGGVEGGGLEYSDARLISMFDDAPEFRRAWY